MNDRDTHTHQPTGESTSPNDSGSPNHQVPEAELDEYIGVSPLTGLPYIKGRPGTPMITSEMVREMLEDFP